MLDPDLVNVYTRSRPCREGHDYNPYPGQCCKVLKHKPDLKFKSLASCGISIPPGGRCVRSKNPHDG